LPRRFPADSSQLIRYDQVDRAEQREINDPPNVYTPERLSPEAERGLGQGSLRAATDVVRGVHSASGAVAPRTGQERATLERDLFKREEAALAAWAEKSGLMLDSAEFWRKHKAANDHG